MKKLILIRHGDYKQVDDQYLLNDEGRQQMNVLAAKLKEFVGVARVALHTSSAPRAAASADIIAKTLGVTATEHYELWSGGDGVGHDPDILAMVESIQEWQKECDILLLVTHMEFVNRLPNRFANQVFQTAMRAVPIEKGQAGVIDYTTQTMTLLA